MAVATKGISIEVLNGILSVGRHGLLRPVEFMFVYLSIDIGNPGESRYPSGSGLYNR